MSKITYTSQSVNKDRNNEWVWVCPLCLDNKPINVCLQGVQSFKTKREAVADVKKVLKWLNITKNAKKI